MADIPRFGTYQLIENKTSDFHPSFSQYSYFVQDYNSAVMRAGRRLSWFMRTYIHSVCNPSARVYMCTLTYNDVCIPSFNCRHGYLAHGHVNPKKADFSKDFIPCFCKKDVQKFFKKLRKRLPNCGIKYLICSEYGPRFTKRSHYHAIIFIDGDVERDDFFSACKESWTYTEGRGLGTRYLPLGNIYWSKSKVTQNYEVKDPSAFKYVSKYITKDLYFLDNERWQNMPESYKEKFKEYQPFHLQSTNFACDWYKHFPVMDSLLNGIPCTFTIKGSIVKKRYPLPAYCVDRLFFKHVYMSCVKDGEKHVVHKKVVRKKQLHTYMQYCKDVCRLKARDVSIKYPHLQMFDLYKLFLWSKIRGIMSYSYDGALNYAGLSLDDSLPSVSELESLVSSVNGSKCLDIDQLKYTYKYNEVEKYTQMGFKPLFSTPIGAHLDQQLKELYTYLSNHAEKNQKVLDKKMDDAKFAIESAANYSAI